MFLPTRPVDQGVKFTPSLHSIRDLLKSATQNKTEIRQFMSMLGNALPRYVAPFADEQITDSAVVQRLSKKLTGSGALLHIYFIVVLGSARSPVHYFATPQ
jgi:hypothetical protein